MRRLTKILIAFGIVAVLVSSYFVLAVAGYRIVVDDMNEEGDVYDNVDTDGDGIPNVIDDDIDGDEIDNDDDADSDGDGVPDDEDEDPVIPNDDENNNGIPDVLEPIAVMKISGIDIRFCIVDALSPRIAYTGFTSYPIVTVLPYTGTAEPVYDWVQGKPLFIYPDPEEVEVEYYIRILVQSDFRSTEYVYNYEDFNDDKFSAVWESEKFVDNVKIYSDLSFFWDMSADNLPDDAWNYINVDTGNCYLWESGQYNINIQMFATFGLNGHTYSLVEDRLYIPSFEVVQS